MMMKFKKRRKKKIPLNNISDIEDQVNYLSSKSINVFVKLLIENLDEKSNTTDIEKEIMKTISNACPALLIVMNYIMMIAIY
jgi:hypothetical protein